jgi:hypothetical protein
MPPTSAYIVGRILSAIRAKPARNSVDMNSIANKHSLFAHCNNSAIISMDLISYENFGLLNDENDI